jgi:hypothetical protein
MIIGQNENTQPKTSMCKAFPGGVGGDLIIRISAEYEYELKFCDWWNGRYGETQTEVNINRIVKL